MQDVKIYYSLDLREGHLYEVYDLSTRFDAFWMSIRYAERLFGPYPKGLQDPVICVAIPWL